MACARLFGYVTVVTINNGHVAVQISASAKNTDYLKKKEINISNQRKIGYQGY